MLTSVTPGCYAFKFLVDGEWKTREGDELEEDEKGELNAIIIVEEEDEDEEEAVEATAEEVKAAEAVKEAVEKVEDDLDVLTLNISQCGEKSFMEMTAMNEVIPEVEKVTVKKVELAEEDEPKEEQKKVDEVAKPEIVKEALKKAAAVPPVENKENTPKVVKEAPTKRVTRRSILPGTPTLPTTPKVTFS